MKRWTVFVVLMGIVLIAHGQRVYAPQSILSEGQWVKISISGPGICKVSYSQLKKWGLGSDIASASIQLFGNGGQVLSENTSGRYIDDLRENAIEVIDGGDGKLDGDDYFLFYASGPNRWVFDSIQRSFIFLKNPYSNKAYYFIRVNGANGLRISEENSAGQPTVYFDKYDDRFRYEKDSINFLKSGKEWYGELIGSSSAGISGRAFTIPWPSVLSGSEARWVSEVVGRSFDQPNLISMKANGNAVGAHSTAPLLGNLLEPVANVSRVSSSFSLNTSRLQLDYAFTSGSINAQAWLNWFEVFAQRPLDFSGQKQMEFRLIESVFIQQPAGFQLKNATASTRVWNITYPEKPNKVKSEVFVNALRFPISSGVMSEFIAFEPSSALEVEFEGKVVNQNLHGLGFYEIVVISDPLLRAEANRLSTFHSSRGLKGIVIDPFQIYNEFSSGAVDPGAFRDFMKMLYDRAGSDISKRPKYLLLFGGASYDFRGNNSKQKNAVPSYQTESSLDPLTSYVTDDFFGYLDDGDNINGNLPAPLLDLAIGRIPARTPVQARAAVDKIIGYHDPKTLGNWRSRVTFVADDEDFNLHLNDAEFHVQSLNTDAPQLNIEKIYLDAFKQESGLSGQSYPDVNASINHAIQRGALVWNYSGHGGSTRLAQENILDRDQISGWQNQGKLPLLVTATCDFARFDDPSQFSLGEDLLVGRTTGGIGLLTTSRLVFASSNKEINNSFLKFLFKRNGDGVYPKLGEALRESKNFSVSNTGDFINARKFLLLGDPSLGLAIPVFKARTVSINGNTNLRNDTLKSLNSYEIEGEVLAASGQPATGFNGTAFIEIMDKPMERKTLANDAQSLAVPIASFENFIYRGQVKIENGKFRYRFVVPADIELRVGAGKISYYVENGEADGLGIDNEIRIGGLGNSILNDNRGPELQAFLNSETFKNGDVVNEQPLLIVKVSDVSGINLSRVNVGHDIIAVLDNQTKSPFVLNDFYQPEFPGENRGIIRFPLPKLSEGNHKIFIRAWDVFNNSSTVEIEFVVEVFGKISIVSFKNYPNPVASSSTFEIGLDGNTFGSILNLRLLSGQGQLLWDYQQAINESTLRFIQVVWDGNDPRGNRLARGAYYVEAVVKNKLGVVSRQTRTILIH